MIRKTLITLQDIQQYRPISDMDEKRISPFILEAQQSDLRPLMNDALYTDFISKVDVSTDPMYANYQTLLRGATYLYAGRTIEYPGLVPIIAYYALARLVRNNQLNVTNYGVVQKSNPNSEPASSKAVDELAKELRAVAWGYGIQFQKYAYINIATYPLYGYKYSQSEVNSGGLRFF